MVKIAFPVMAAMLQTSSAAILIQGEDGSSYLVHDDYTVSQDLSATGSSYSIESCMTNGCNSPTAKANLVAACKQGGYSSCDGLAYHATYMKDHSGNPIFKNTNNVFTYGTPTTSYSSESVNSAQWNNGLKLPQVQTFSKNIVKSVEQTWTNTVTATVSDTLSVTEKAGLPGIVQEEITDTLTVSLDTSTTTSQTKTTTQTWEESQTINVPAETCIEACMIERDGVVTAPYTFTGHIAGTYSLGDGLYAAQCCYLRPGGSGDCSGLGSATGASGWSFVAPPTYFIQAANAAGMAQCKGFGTSGNDAVFSGSGTFKGGMGFNISIATVLCGKTCNA